MANKQLDSLHIHAFRGIRDLELKDLGQINLFVGVNNCGKTSLLEAISLYCNPLSLKSWYITSLERELGSNFSKSIPDLISWLFPYKDSMIGEFDQSIIEITSDGIFDINKLQAFLEPIERIKGNQYGQLSLFDNLSSEEDIILDEHTNNAIEKGILLKVEILTRQNISQTPIIKKFDLWDNDKRINLRKSNELESIQSGKIDCVEILSSSHLTRFYQASGLLTLAKMKSSTSEVIQLLQCLDPNIQDLEILTVSGINSRQLPVIHIEHKKLGLVPLKIFGDGVRRLVFIALQLIHFKKGILLIDEIETAVHTEALQDSFTWIVKWCKQLDIQLFATTHSLEAVDAILAATEDTDTDLVLYRLEQKDSKTSAIRIARDRLQRLRENLGQEVRW